MLDLKAVTTSSDLIADAIERDAPLPPIGGPLELLGGVHRYLERMAVQAYGERKVPQRLAFALGDQLARLTGLSIRGVKPDCYTTSATLLEVKSGLFRIALSLNCSGRVAGVLSLSDNHI